MSFRREAHVARGGPDGGDGGAGGDVWLVADHNLASLVSLRDQPHLRAADGTHGSGARRHGTRGDDRIVPVPEGTVVRDTDGTVLADLVATGDRFLAARGGRGGRGNARFLTNRRRAPAFAEQGEPGEERWLRLELKLVADVALVGMPNAGKSTLISRISAARPRIGDYPFTTLVPNLGVVRAHDTEMVVADVPGLIEGAADGRGLGHRFLRHTERTRVLVILCDLASHEWDPHRQLEILTRELERYDPALARRPRIVVGSRADVAHHDWEGPRISAVTGEGVDRLVARMADAVRAARREGPGGESFRVFRPLEDDLTVRREGRTWVVEGRQALRAVALSDLTDPEALEVAHRRLRRAGVDAALRRAGVAEGDTVRIGDLELTWTGDDA